jgi:hypothetical protein
MVILTDFIREEFFPKKGESEPPLRRMGVVPIFEKIRREFSGTKKIGILSGSIVVIPCSAKETLKKVAEDLDIPKTHVRMQKLAHDENFLSVTITGENNQKIVHLITEIFARGEIEILVGTKSLLGEGWDAPSINTLVLASFVGSFMVSNQMRGRAIRIDHQKPDKVSNIWHLATVEKDMVDAGHDFEMLKRRFQAFVGVSMGEHSIENGFERMNIGSPPFSERDIKNINEKVIFSAQDRTSTKEAWETVLESGKIKKIIPEIKTGKERLPRHFVLYNTIFALFWRSLLSGVFFFLQSLEGIAKLVQSRQVERLVDFLGLIGIVVGISLLISLPGLLKSLWLFLRNGPISGNMEQIGTVLLKTLCKIGAIKTDGDTIRVLVKKNKSGQIFCGLEGGTSYEKSLFLDCLEEILNPIDNPRYILIRKSRLNFLLREDFHTVPKIIGAHKKSAEFFALMWYKHIGPSKLIYTRNIKGRKLLLRARQKAMSTSFQNSSERMNTWR